MESMKWRRTMGIGWEHGVYVNVHRGEKRTFESLVRKGVLRRCSVPQDRRNGYAFTDPKA